jgi:hypothetical protein
MFGDYSCTYRRCNFAHGEAELSPEESDSRYADSVARSRVIARAVSCNPSVTAQSIPPSAVMSLGFQDSGAARYASGQRSVDSFLCRPFPPAPPPRPQTLRGLAGVEIGVQDGAGVGLNVGGSYAAGGERVWSPQIVTSRRGRTQGKRYYGHARGAQSFPVGQQKSLNVPLALSSQGSSMAATPRIPPPSRAPPEFASSLSSDVPAAVIRNVKEAAVQPFLEGVEDVVNRVLPPRPWAIGRDECGIFFLSKETMQVTVGLCVVFFSTNLLSCVGCTESSIFGETCGVEVIDGTEAILVGEMCWMDEDLFTDGGKVVFFLFLDSMC